MFMRSALYFVCGAVFGNAGKKLLTSKEAKKVYAKTIALGLRGYDALTETTQKLQSEFDSVMTQARQLNDEHRRNVAEEAQALEF